MQKDKVIVMVSGHRDRSVDVDAFRVKTNRHSKPHYTITKLYIDLDHLKLTGSTLEERRNQIEEWCHQFSGTFSIQDYVRKRSPDERFEVDTIILKDYCEIGDPTPAIRMSPDVVMFAIDLASHYDCGLWQEDKEKSVVLSEAVFGSDTFDSFLSLGNLATLCACIEDTIGPTPRLTEWTYGSKEFEEDFDFVEEDQD